MSAPDVAVVIASVRDARLAFTLEALAGQSLGRERFEVIVVRDPGLAAVPAPAGLAVSFLPPPRALGPAAWRNAGWRSSSASLIAFTDDDCRPAPDWLESLLAALPEHGFVVGRTAPDPEQTHLGGGLARSHAAAGGDRAFRACNAAYRRALLDRLGGFDEGYAEPLGEGTDLALRALAQGESCGYAEDALVWHAVLPRTLTVAIREALRWRERARVLARNPADRESLRLGLFVSRVHATVPPLALALTLGRRRPLWAAALAAPYLWTRLRGSGRPEPGTLLSLPLQALADTAEVGATIAGAVRERAPIV